jgi:hypothetical protein
MKRTVRLTENQLRKLFVSTINEQKKKKKKCEVTIQVPKSICDVCKESGMSEKEICDLYNDFMMDMLGFSDESEHDYFISWAKEQGTMDDEEDDDDEEEYDDEEDDDDDDDEEDDDDDDDDEEYDDKF